MRCARRRVQEAELTLKQMQDLRMPRSLVDGAREHLEECRRTRDAQESEPLTPRPAQVTRAGPVTPGGGAEVDRCVLPEAAAAKMKETSVVPRCQRPLVTRWLKQILRTEQMGSSLWGVLLDKIAIASAMLPATVASRQGVYCNKKV